MISNEKEFLKLAKEHGRIHSDGWINERDPPDPDKFPELIGKYGEKETFIKRWFEYAKEYNRKLKNKKRVLENPDAFKDL